MHVLGFRYGFLGNFCQPRQQTKFTGQRCTRLVPGQEKTVPSKKQAECTGLYYCGAYQCCPTSSASLDATRLHPACSWAKERLCRPRNKLNAPVCTTAVHLTLLPNIFSVIGCYKVLTQGPHAELEHHLQRPHQICHPHEQPRAQHSTHPRGHRQTLSACPFPSLLQLQPPLWAQMLWLSGAYQEVETQWPRRLAPSRGMLRPQQRCAAPRHQPKHQLTWPGPPLKHQG